MKTIFKYNLEPADYISVSMPKGSEVLSVQMQRNRPCLWALVDPKAPNERRTFRFSGTGHPISDTNLKFIDTIQMMGGDLIFHIFEVL